MGLAVDVDRLAFGYSPSARVLHDVSFAIGSGDAVCLLGANGSGKTTLLRCLLALQRVDAGSIRILGQDIQRLTRRQLARMIAYVPQTSSVIFPFTVLDVVLMGRTAHLDTFAVPSSDDQRRALRALDELGIAHLAQRPFQRVSGGERQLALIARALCQDAQVLVMDEPTASLDYGNQIRVLKIVKGLRESGYAVIMSAHNPDHAFITSTHAAIIDGGRVVAFGAPSAIITSQRLSELYGTAIQVMSATADGATQSVPVTVCVPRFES